MEWRLLGPVEVSVGGKALCLPGGMPRAVLAMLLLDTNRVVSTARLVAALWGPSSPPAAVGSLYNHLTRLRRSLGASAASRVRSVSGGYVLLSEDDELDLQVFTEWCRRGRALLRVRDWVGAADAFAAGLALWRGEPLAGLPATGFFQAQSQWLVELRLHALRSRIEADLLAGRHDQLVAELTALTTGYPLTEAFHRQLMLALYRTGRACDALSVYERASRVLREDLGVDPGPDLTGMHERILNHDPDLTWQPTDVGHLLDRC